MGESKRGRARERGREQKRARARERFNFQTTAISQKNFHQSRRFHRSIINRSQNQVFSDRRSIDRSMRDDQIGDSIMIAQPCVSQSSPEFCFSISLNSLSISLSHDLSSSSSQSLYLPNASFSFIPLSRSHLFSQSLLPTSLSPLIFACIFS